MDRWLSVRSLGQISGLVLRVKRETPGSAEPDGDCEASNEGALARSCQERERLGVQSKKTIKQAR